MWNLPFAEQVLIHELMLAVNAIKSISFRFYNDAFMHTEMYRCTPGTIFLFTHTNLSSLSSSLSSTRKPH